MSFILKTQANAVLFLKRRFYGNSSLFSGLGCQLLGVDVPTEPSMVALKGLVLASDPSASWGQTVTENRQNPRTRSGTKDPRRRRALSSGTTRRFRWLKHSFCQRKLRHFVCPDPCERPYLRIPPGLRDGAEQPSLLLKLLTIISLRLFGQFSLVHEVLSLCHGAWILGPFAASRLKGRIIGLSAIPGGDPQLHCS